MMRRRQERDIKLKLQKGEYKRKKNKKRSVRVCGREIEGWGERHKKKVIELPETQIYTDLIDHRLKQ